MPPTEIGRGDAILGGKLGEAEFADEDGVSVWTGNTVQTVKKDAEALGVEEETLYQVKVKDRFEELDIIND